MSLMTIRNLSKSFHGQTLFQDLNLSISEGDKIALIGANGSGKTTLLRILTGEIMPDTGILEKSNDLVIGYLDQQPIKSQNMGKNLLDTPELNDLLENIHQEELNLSRLGTQLSENKDPMIQKALDESLRRYEKLQHQFDAMGGHDYPARLARVLSALGLQGKILEQDFQKLSGGEKMRAALAKLLLTPADLLFLDEPTNHLDLSGLSFLADFLASYKGSVLIVSHDRYFLDQICNRTLEIENHRIYSYKGNYTDSQKLREEAKQQRERDLKKLNEALEHEKAVAQTLRSHRKIASWQSRLKVVDRIQDQIQTLRANSLQDLPKMKFSFCESDDDKNPNRLLVEAVDLSLSFEKKLFSGLNLNILASDKIAILGANGTGKSSLLKILLGSLEADSGRLKLYGNPKIAFMGQHISFPDEEATIYDFMCSEREEPITQLRSRLASYAFSADSIDKPIKVLSGGERHRLYLCRLLMDAPDIIFLDEPTNHLDIRSRELLEIALKDYKGAILCVSHDRYFIRAITDKSYGFLNQEFKAYDHYEAWVKALLDNQANSDLLVTASEKKLTSTKSGKTEKRSNLKNRKERSKQRVRLREIENLLECLEKEKVLFESENPIEKTPEDYQHYAEILNEIEQLSDEWLLISETLELAD